MPENPEVQLTGAGAQKEPDPREGPDGRAGGEGGVGPEAAGSTQRLWACL